eukprot:TRINITY_DN32848_c0_g1_i1.p1 TRINITY_DN32848_c0_g1~~TRINITY_DN32848_c0_g1_i1.p1  ORF type:complete len:273 (-),score=55.44 TRINITY_DN32848_c0_g1_i1:21-839(-)
MVLQVVCLSLFSLSWTAATASSQACSFEDCLEGELSAADQSEGGLELLQHRGRREGCVPCGTSHWLSDSEVLSCCESSCFQGHYKFDHGSTLDCSATPIPASALLESDHGLSGELEPKCPECSTPGEGCLSTGCCKGAGLRCFKKNDDWADCMASCQPGELNPNDPPLYRTPWTCEVVEKKCEAEGGAQAQCCDRGGCKPYNPETQQCCSSPSSSTVCAKNLGCCNSSYNEETCYDLENQQCCHAQAEIFIRPAKWSCSDLSAGGVHGSPAK